MELTPELKKEILESYIRGLGLEPAKLTRVELEKEIINYEGEAKIYTFKDKEEVMKVFTLFKEDIEQFKKEMKGINPPPPDLMKIIKIMPKKIRYICFAKGIGDMEWKAEE